MTHTATLPTSLAHLAAYTVFLLAGCGGPTPCPHRDHEDLIRTLDPATAPSPQALEVAQRWAATEGVDPAVTPRLAVALSEHALSFPFWELLVRVAPSYELVASALAARGLPEALAAVPLSLSKFEAGVSPVDCGGGPWRLSPIHPGVRVAGCRLRQSSILWTPPAEPDGGLVIDDRCQLVDCNVDERDDLGRATQAALASIDARWDATPPGGRRLITVVERLTNEESALEVAACEEEAPRAR